MWAYRLEGPLQLVRHEIPPPSQEELPDGHVILKFLAGGVCGSDIARCKDLLSTGGDQPFGRSLHEIVGEVVATRSDLTVGERVVGWVGDTSGLRELVPADGLQLLPAPAPFDNVHAAPLQPLACVLWAMSRLGDVRGKRAAVIGLGPIGLLFAHALKSGGSRLVAGVDAVDRSDVAGDFGIDEVVQGTSRAWAHSSPGEFDVVVEAVGHQVGTLDDAISVAAVDATVLYFGNPDDEYYPIPFGTMMDRNLVLRAGRTPRPDRRAALRRAFDYVQRHPSLLDSYVTDVLPVSDAQEAYARASRPAPGQLKVVLDAAS